MRSSHCARSYRSTSTSWLGATLLASGLVLASLPISADPGQAPADENATAAHAAPAQAVVYVTIANFTFSPATLHVRAGTRLVWTNRDDSLHTVRGVEGDSPIASQPLDTDDSYSVIMARPGTYEYFCTLHPVMVGTIIVE
jgi:plastocyanin